MCQIPEYEALAKKILKQIASLDMSYNSYESMYDTCEILQQYINVTNFGESHELS